MDTSPFQRSVDAAESAFKEQKTGFRPVPLTRKKQFILGFLDGYNRIPAYDNPFKVAQGGFQRAWLAGWELGITWKDDGK